MIGLGPHGIRFARHRLLLVGKRRSWMLVHDASSTGWPSQASRLSSSSRGNGLSGFGVLIDPTLREFGERLVGLFLLAERRLKKRRRLRQP